MPPYLFLAFSACGRLPKQWERHGSPKFRCKPLNDLPWTQTPARRDALTIPHAAILASRENNLWPSCDDGYFGAQYLHLRYGRSFAIPLASRDSLPPHVQSSVQARSVNLWPGWIVQLVYISFDLAHTSSCAMHRPTDQSVPFQSGQWSTVRARRDRQACRDGRHDPIPC